MIVFFLVHSIKLFVISYFKLLSIQGNCSCDEQVHLNTKSISIFTREKILSTN